MILCDYGCGQEAKYQFKNGKWCCSIVQQSCLGLRKRQSETPRKKYKSHSKEANRKQSERMKGNISWNKGLTKETDERIRKQSDKMKGRKKGPFSKEHRKNMSKAQKGKKRGPLSEEHRKKLKGRPSWSKGLTKETDERVRKISDKMKGRDGLKGELNPNWKGGITPDNYCPLWLDEEYKESIRKRDDYKCLNPECNKKSFKLHLHHINYNKKDCSPLNIITICNSCNSKANFDRDWHQSWYEAIIYRRYCKYK